MIETTGRGQHAHTPEHTDSPNQQNPAHITLPGTVSARHLSSLCPWAASWVWIPSPWSTRLPWWLGSSLHCSSRKPLTYLAMLLLLACAPGSGPVWAPRPSAPCMLRGLRTKHSTAPRTCSCTKLCLHLPAYRAWRNCLLALGRQCTQKFCLLQSLRLISHCVAWATSEEPGQFSSLGV